VGIIDFFSNFRKASMGQQKNDDYLKIWGMKKIFELAFIAFNIWLMCMLLSVLSLIGYIRWTVASSRQI